MHYTSNIGSLYRTIAALVRHAPNLEAFHLTACEPDRDVIKALSALPRLAALTLTFTCTFPMLPTRYPEDTDRSIFVIPEAERTRSIDGWPLDDDEFADGGLALRANQEIYLPSFRGLRSLVLADIQGDVLMWRMALLHLLLRNPQLENLSLSRGFYLAANLYEDSDGEVLYDEEVELAAAKREDNARWRHIVAWVFTAYAEHESTPPPPRLRLRALRLSQDLAFPPFSVLERAVDPSRLEKIAVYLTHETDGEGLSTTAVPFPLLTPDTTPSLRHLAVDGFGIRAVERPAYRGCYRAPLGVRSNAGAQVLLADEFLPWPTQLITIASEESLRALGDKGRGVTHLGLAPEWEGYPLPLFEGDGIEYLTPPEGERPWPTKTEAIRDAVSKMPQLEGLWIMIDWTGAANAHSAAMREAAERALVEVVDSCPSLTYLRVGFSAWRIHSGTWERIDGRQDLLLAPDFFPPLEESKVIRARYDYELSRVYE